MFINKGLQLFLLMFFFLIINARAIPTDTVYIYADSLEKKQVNIDGVWRYHPGDDSLWAQSDFDDSQWDTLDPSINKMEDFRNKWQGFGWFRKIIVFDSAQTGKNFAIIMRHVGASEVYLNGIKALSYGKINPDSLEEGYSSKRRPYVISPDSSSIQVVAVRYENKITKQYPRFYKRFIDNMGFRMGLRSTNPAIQSFSANLFGNTFLNTLLAGIFISLFLLYFLLFLFYARKKENLLYALFTLSLGILLVANPVRYTITTGPFAITLSTIVPLAFLLLLFVAYVGFLYAIFYTKNPKWSWIYLFLAFAVLLSIIFAAEDATINIMLGIYAVVMSVEGLRVIIVAIKRKKTGAWIIGTGVIVFVFMMVMSVLINTLDLQLSGKLALLMVFSGILGLPITMSIYLAKTVARTNFDLEKQLETVKELSAKELESEKRNADLSLRAEKEKAAAKEAQLRAEAAEHQARASEAQARIIQAENERKSKELEEARQLQLSLLPQELPELNHLQINAFMKTATEVGGDYYDFFVDKNNVLTGVIGDATGHGLNAGTMVTATKSLFVSHGDEDDIVNILEEFNRSLKKLNFRFLFMCLQVFRIKEYTFEITSAGMPPVFIHRKAIDEVEEILLKGLPLGSTTDTKYQLRKTTLQKGDTILFMSDGFAEVLDVNGNMFGYENVARVFGEVAEKGSEDIIKHLEEVATRWTEGEEPDDDMTFLVIKVS